MHVAALLTTPGSMVSLGTCLVVLLVGAAVAAAAGEGTSAAPKGPKVVGILLFDGVELLDFTGPAEVFAVAGHGSLFRVVTVAESKAPLATMGGVVVTPSHAFEDAPALDVLVVPGGNMRAVSARGLEWLKGAAAATPITMSVCMGSMLLAKVGLLAGIEATTHHWGLEHLRATVPTCKVVEGRRFVDAGRIVTTAGVTAGIDGALHVVSRLCGAEAARWTACEWMEHPTPP
jgi:transcriptional regulator GlxA family with amidase domain